MENKEMLNSTVKFILAVIQLILSAVSLVFCVKYALDAYHNYCNDKQEENEDKILFLDF